MRANIKTQTNPWGFQQNPKKSHAEFPSLKNFPERVWHGTKTALLAVQVSVFNCNTLIYVLPAYTHSGQRSRVSSAPVRRLSRGADSEPKGMI